MRAGGDDYGCVRLQHGDARQEASAQATAGSGPGPVGSIVTFLPLSSGSKAGGQAPAPAFASSNERLSQQRRLCPKR